MQCTISRYAALYCGIHAPTSASAARCRAPYAEARRCGSVPDDAISRTSAIHVALPVSTRGRARLLGPESPAAATAISHVPAIATDEHT
jgi:hypothetical protein